MIIKKFAVFRINSWINSDVKLLQDSFLLSQSSYTWWTDANL